MGFGEDGVPIESPNRIDDHAKSTKKDPLGRTGMKRQPMPEVQSSKVLDNLHQRDTAVNVIIVRFCPKTGVLMQDGFSNEGRKRQEDKNWKGNCLR